MSKVYCIVRTETDVYIPIKAAINPYTGAPAYLKQLPNFFGGTVEEVTYINGRLQTKKRSEHAALCAELSQESRHTINMDEEAILEQMENGILLKTKVYRESKKGVIQENYSFYLLSIPQNPFDDSSQPKAYDLNQISGGQTPEEREMNYIIRVPIVEIINRVIAAAKAEAIAEAETEAIAEAAIHKAEAEATAICRKPNPNRNAIDKFASKILSACSNIQYRTDSHFTDLLNGDSTLKNAWDESETKKAFAILAAVLFLHRPQQ